MIKRKMANWKLKRAEHRNPPRPQAPAVTLTEPTKTSPTRRKNH
ncbi:hypothetical protein [Streptomyces sp. A3M-1-3]|nr:hypothetical protein [Streptomyces sp. A3M-1-3]